LEISIDIPNDLPSDIQQNIQDYILAIDESPAIENILEDIEIVDMVLADAQIEAGIIEDLKEELEKELKEFLSSIITITEAYEALKK
ncbi:16371_t:CDS:1, partial [Acaulospora colombiana]